MTILPEWLRHRAAISPDRTAIVSAEGGLTFAELDDRVSYVSGYLAGREIGPGDRVAVLCGNGLPFALLAHAIPRVGAVLVPVNTRLTPTEIQHQIDDARACAIIHDAEHARVVEQAAPQIASFGVDEIVYGERYGPPERVDVDRVHSIIYTSGTTGEPKGTMLTYGNFWYSAAASALNLGHSAEDRWLAVLPLFHVGGLSILTRSVITGITAIVQGRFDPATANRAIDEEGVTIVSAVSTMLARMLDERNDRPYPPSLRCVLLGGGPAPMTLLERAAACGAPVVQTYGLTETTSQAATLSPEDAWRRPGSAGKPLVTTEIRIERDGRAATAGDLGEILVRGATVTPGYFNRPEATERALRGGWLHTGDIGYLDPAGYVYVVDRRDDLIVSGGENVYPAEVEAVLTQHPAVAEAGVVAIPDERWGQAVAAVIVPRPGSTAADDELLAYCRERLAGYKIPRRIRRVDALPRNAGGKLLRRELRERIMPTET